MKRVSPNLSKAVFFSGRTWPRPLHVLAVLLCSAGWGIGNCGADLLKNVWCWRCHQEKMMDIDGKGQGRPLLLWTWMWPSYDRSLRWRPAEGSGDGISVRLMLEHGLEFYTFCSLNCPTKGHEIKYTMPWPAEFVVNLRIRGKILVHHAGHACHFWQAWGWFKFSALPHYINLPDTSDLLGPPTLTFCQDKNSTHPGSSQESLACEGLVWK